MIFSVLVFVFIELVLIIMRRFYIKRNGVLSFKFALVLINICLAISIILFVVFIKR